MDSENRNILEHIFYEIGNILGWAGGSGDSKLVIKILEKFFGKFS